MDADVTTAETGPLAARRSPWRRLLMVPDESVLPREHRRLVLLIGLATLFAGFDTTIFGLAASRILPEFGVALEQQGPTSALFRFGVFGAIALSILADVVGRRRVLTATVAGMSLATLASGFAPDYWTFVAAQVVVRVFGFAEDMLGVVVIAEEVDEKVRGWALGVVAALGALGAGFAVILYAFEPVLPYGWRSMYVIGGLALLALAILRRSLTETRRFSAAAAASGPRARRDWIKPIVALARRYPGRLGLMLALVAPLAISMAPPYGLFATFVQTQRGFAPAEMSAMIVTGAAVAIVFGMLAGKLSDRFGRKRILLVAMAAGAVGWPVVYFVPEHWAIFLGFIPAVFAQFSGAVLLEALGAELFPTSARATATSIRFLTNVIAGSTALALHGFVTAPALGFGPGAVVFLLAAPLGLVALWFLPETAGRSLDDIAPEAA